MSDNVHVLDVVTRLGMPVQRVFDNALKADLDQVIIIGFDADGQEFFASSQSDGGDVLWHLERAKHKLLQTAD